MKIKSELKEFSHRRSNEGVYADNLTVDVLVVGAGFGGVYCHYLLGRSGLKSVIYEAGTDLGGTWRWNCYPGARVDFEVPEYEYEYEYEYSMLEVYKDWIWTINYLNYKALRAYFDHFDRVLDIKKDCAFERLV